MTITNTTKQVFWFLALLLYQAQVCNTDSELGDGLFFFSSFQSKLFFKIFKKVLSSQNSHYQKPQNCNSSTVRHSKVPKDHEEPLHQAAVYHTASENR